MTERILTFNGTGTLRNWLEPEGLRDAISSALTQLGYGVESVRLGVSPSAAAVVATGVFASQVSYQYGFVVRIRSYVGDDPNKSKNAVAGVLGYWFSNVVLSLTADDTQTQNENGYQVRSNNNPNVARNGLDDFLNKLGGISGGAKTAATIFGLSYGAAAVIGLAAVYFLTQRSAPAVAYKRYYR